MPSPSVSHYNDPLTSSSLGNSRKGSDASVEVKSIVANEIITQARAAGLDAQDIANLLAIAEIESGFNPDASTTARNSTASGVFAITDSTAADAAKRLSGKSLIDNYTIGLPYDRFDYKSNIATGIAVYLDKKRIADSDDISDIYKVYNSNPAEYNKVLPKIEASEQSYESMLKSNTALTISSSSDASTSWDQDATQISDLAYTYDADGQLVSATSQNESDIFVNAGDATMNVMGIDFSLVNGGAAYVSVDGRYEIDYSAADASAVFIDNLLQTSTNVNSAQSLVLNDQGDLVVAQDGATGEASYLYDPENGNLLSESIVDAQGDQTNVSYQYGTDAKPEVDWTYHDGNGKLVEDVDTLSDGSTTIDNFSYDSSGALLVLDAEELNANNQVTESGSYNFLTHTLIDATSTYANVDDVNPSSTETLTYVSGHETEDKVVTASGTDDTLYAPYDGVASEETVRDSSGNLLSDTTNNTDGSASVVSWTYDDDGDHVQLDVQTLNSDGQLIEDGSYNYLTHTITETTSTFDTLADTQASSSETLVYVNGQETEDKIVDGNGTDDTLYAPYDGVASEETVRDTQGNVLSDTTNNTDGSASVVNWTYGDDGAHVQFDVQTLNSDGQKIEDGSYNYLTHTLTDTTSTFDHPSDTQAASSETLVYVNGHETEDKIVDGGNTDDTLYQPWDGVSSYETISDPSGTSSNITTYTDGSVDTSTWQRDADGNLVGFQDQSFNADGQLVEEGTVDLGTYTVMDTTLTYGSTTDTQAVSTETITDVRGVETDDKITYADGSIDDTAFDPFPGVDSVETLKNAQGQLTTEYDQSTGGMHDAIYYVYNDGVAEPSFIGELYDAQNDLTEIIKQDSVSQLYAVITPTTDGFAETITDLNADPGSQQSWTEQDKTFSFDATNDTVSLLTDTTYLRDGTTEQDVVNADNTISFTDTDTAGTQEWSEVTGTKQIFGTADGDEFLVTQSRTVHDDGSVDQVSYARNGSDPVNDYQVTDTLSSAGGQTLASFSSDTTGNSYDVQYFQTNDADISRIDEHYQIVTVGGQPTFAETSETDYAANGGGYTRYDFDPGQPNITQESIYNGQGVETMSGTITLNADQSVQESFTDLSGAESWTSGSITLSADGQSEALSYVERDTSSGVGSETYNFVKSGSDWTETGDVLNYTGAYGGIVETDVLGANGSVDISLSNSSDQYNWSTASMVQQQDGSFSGTTYSDSGATLMQVNYQAANDDLVTHIYDSDGSWTNSDDLNWGTAQEQDSVMVYNSQANLTTDEVLNYSAPGSVYSVTEGSYNGNYDYLSNEFGSSISQSLTDYGSISDPIWVNSSYQIVGGYNDYADYSYQASEDYADYSFNDYQDYSTPDFYDVPSSSYDLGGYDVLNEFSSYASNDYSYDYNYGYGSSIDYGSFDSFGGGW